MTTHPMVLATKDFRAKRVGEPGLYTCPHCGETLSSPARFYTCPLREARSAARSTDEAVHAPAREVVRQIRALADALPA